MKKNKELEPLRMSDAELSAYNQLGMFFQSLQHYYNMDHLAFFAVLASAVGATTGLNDDNIEKEMKDAKVSAQDREDYAEVYKRIFLLNFDIAYNEARSERARVETVTPKREV